MVGHAWRLTSLLVQVVYRVHRYAIVLSSVVVSKTAENINMIYCYRLSITSACHVARMGETRNEFSALWGNMKERNDLEELG
jgi:hypothetical protein